jgi:limonene-1,2-epoxide hydrolase
MVMPTDANHSSTHNGHAATTLPADAEKSPATAGSDPADVVVAFLRAFERFDVETAVDLVHDDLVYINVTLPALRGRERLATIARAAVRPGRMGFHVHFNHIATDGDVVLTDRIDEIDFGRFAMRFWVYGRFVVRDGRIAVWRDAFDWVDVTVGALRGLVGVVAPALNRRMPSDRYCR